MLRRLREANLPASSWAGIAASELWARPRRRWLLRRRLGRQRRLPGMTALVGVRDRAGPRLRNLLRSLDEQSARDRLRIVVVDYGSRLDLAAEVAELAAAARADVLRVEGATAWSRAAALNAGIRRVMTDFVLCADADLVFDRSYVATALERLEADPRRIVVSSMLDLPEGPPRDLAAADFAAARATARARYDAPYHPSIIAVATVALVSLGGYDESFRLWGTEDVDLFTRLRVFGLKPEDVHREAVYLHQWHAKHEGVGGVELATQIEANERHFQAKRGVGALRVGGRRKAIVTAAGPHMWPLLERYSLPTFRRFAETFDYDVLPTLLKSDGGEHGVASNAARFAKLPLLRDALADYELVVWIDADIMICRFDDDLSAHLAPGKFQGFALEQVPQDRRVNPNSGVWLLRRDPRAHRFLRAVERTGQQRGPWADQATIMKLLGWNAGTEIYHDAGPGRGSVHLDGTGWLPPSWNQLHGVPGEDADGANAVPRVHRPHAVHFAGMSNEQREPLMRDLLWRIEAGAA